MIRVCDQIHNLHFTPLFIRAGTSNFTMYLSSGGQSQTVMWLFTIHFMSLNWLPRKGYLKLISRAGVRCQVQAAASTHFLVLLWEDIQTHAFTYVYHSMHHFIYEHCIYHVFSLKSYEILGRTCLHWHLVTECQRHAVRPEHCYTADPGNTCTADQHTLITLLFHCPYHQW